MALAPKDFDFSFAETKVGGYAIGLERKDQLLNSKYVIGPAMLAKHQSEELPKLILPEYSPVENQSNQGACQGHSLSTCKEDCRVRAGGNFIQLSRACGYYESQRIDGIRGDSGSTIEGGVRLLETKGICTEDVWPYPSRYDNRRPRGWEDSIRYKIEGHVPITKFDDMIRFIAFRGPVHIGITWSGDIDQQVGRDGIVRTYSGRGGGGHSVAMNGLTFEDWRGNPLPNDEPGIILTNSWGNWGYKGRCIVLRRAYEQMVRARWSVFMGLFGSVSPALDDLNFEPI